MSSTIENELDSFDRRYLKETPEFNKKLNWELVTRICDRLVNRMVEKHLANGEKPFDYVDFFESKKGALGSRYKNALNSLNTKGFDSDLDSHIGAFLKNERYFEEKPARFIMGRDPKFNILYAKYIQPSEKAFFSLEEVCNACDFSKCGEKFKKLVFNDTDFLENDFSKYESSQRDRMLRIEYYVLREFLKNVDPSFDEEEFCKLFTLKTRKKGKTPCGLRFSFLWCRGSGDMDTGLGNGILNYVSSEYFLIMNDCPLKQNCEVIGSCCKRQFILKGDDSVLSAKNKDYVNYYSDFGFDAKLLHKRNWWEVEFCSGHYVKNGENFFYVQKLDKLLASLQSVINERFFNGIDSYYYSLGVMYEQVYCGMPVYADLARYLKSCGGNFHETLSKESYGIWEAYDYMKSNKSQPKFIGDKEILMLDISMFTGISIPELNNLISFFRTNTLYFPERFCTPIKMQRGHKTSVEQLQLLRGIRVSVPDELLCIYKYYKHTIVPNGRICRIA